MKIGRPEPKATPGERGRRGLTARKSVAAALDWSVRSLTHRTVAGMGMVGVLGVGLSVFTNEAPGLQGQKPLLVGGPAEIIPAPEPRRVRQPVHEYFTVFDPGSPGWRKIDEKVNPFLAYTHLGTDFGFIGTGQEGIGWESGSVSIHMPGGLWGGMWHSLEGMGSDLDHVLDFRACYPPFFAKRFQPRIVGMELRGKGKGAVKLEIKSARQQTLWQRSFDVDSPDMHTFCVDVNPEDVGRAKFLNWVAEPGTEGVLDSVGFVIEAPGVPFDEYVFLASYAKLARCFSMRTAYVRDRAHIRDGYFDNVPACGLFAVSTVLAARQGFVSENFAHDLVRRIEDNVSRLKTAGGVLPHFVMRQRDGRYGILPGTEFSLVDTAIYYHGMLLAGELLGDQALLGRLEESIRTLQLGEGMVDAEGYIRHGVREDRVTPLQAVWRDWGGETALVLALARMSGNGPPPRMAATGKAHEGTGFIAEIQSLFYPDFDDPAPDVVSRQSWPAVRKALLTQQKAYFPTHWPQSEAARDGFYGLSAGEARHGIGYMVSGVDLPGQTIIHPHYLLMSACLEEDPESVYDILRRLEEHQMLAPWGLAENFTKEVNEFLPMLGALNAGLECISAYHLLAKHRGLRNEAHAACLRNRLLRQGASVFYPSAATSFADSSTGRSITAR